MNLVSTNLYLQIHTINRVVKKFLLHLPSRELWEPLGLFICTDHANTHATNEKKMVTLKKTAASPFVTSVPVGGFGAFRG
jgi:hypothetical protein